MSKNIIIKKDGVAQNFDNISVIRVPQPDGMTENWVPEDECQCATIEITENGTYNAEELGEYGFNEVQVHVPKEDQVVGIGSDGKAYKIIRDDTTGYLVREEIPTRIVITTKPTKRSYVVGETIDYTDMEVTLYGKDGSIFTDETYDTGIVPTSELSLPAETAEKGKSYIHVYWLSPYTSRVLEDRFKITITEASP